MEQSSGRQFEVTERLYKDKDGNVVPAGSPDADSLFKNAGAKIPLKQARELGLVEEESDVKEPSANKQAEKPAAKKAPTAANKQRSKPAKNK